MLLSDFISEGSRALECIYPSEEARSLVLRLCGDVLGTRSYTHIIEPGYEIAPSLLDGLQKSLDRLASGEPVQYVEGSTEFCGLTFKVSPDVLIPRPETEELVRTAVERIAVIRTEGSDVRVLDLCTGSGCIAWSVAALSPGTEVVAVDVSEPALSVARSQAPGVMSGGVVAPHFVRADILDLSRDFCQGQFDMILSNPPYVMDSEKSVMRRNVLDYEPHLALFVPDDDPLVFYRAVAEWSRRLLRPGGWGMVEINEALPERTAAVFEAYGFVNVAGVRDFFGKFRFISFEKPAL